MPRERVPSAAQRYITSVELASDRWASHARRHSSMEQRVAQIFENRLKQRFGEKFWPQVALEDHCAKNRADEGQPPLDRGARRLIQIFTKQYFDEIAAGKSAHAVVGMQ